ALAAVQASTRAACWQQSLAALRQTSSPPVVLFNACAASCSKGRQWRAAILLAEEIHCLGLEATVVTCNTRIKAAGSEEMNWASTLDFLRAAQKQSVRSDAVTWNSAADACSGQGDPDVWPQALQLLDGLSWRGLESDGVTATLRIKRASWPAAMLHFSHTAESFFGKAAKVGVNAGLSSLALGTAWGYGTSLLHTMRHRAVELDPMALTAAIALYSGEEASDAWMHSLQLLENIHAFGLDQGTARGAARVDRVAISSAMTVCTNHQLWEHALSLFEALMEARRADVVSFGSAISAAASGRLWELALHLHEEMPNMQLAPNQVTFNAVIAACEQGLQWEVAVSMLPSMRLLLIMPDVVSYTSTISACGQAQCWLDAIQLLGEALQLRLRTNIMSLSSAISACEKAGQWQAALQLLGKARDLGLEPSTITCNAAISACEKCCRWTEALHLLSEMNSLALPQSSITQSVSIAACARGRAWEHALWLFGQGQLLQTYGSELFAACASTISACEMESSRGAAQTVPAMLARICLLLEEPEAQAQVLTVEILSDFGALPSRGLNIQRRRLRQKMLKQCRILCGYRSGWSVQEPSWRLHDPVLEQESFLGASLTQKLLQQLQLAPTGDPAAEPWLPTARAAARTAPALTSSADANEAEQRAKAISAWTGASVDARVSEAHVSIQYRSRVHQW
ncbi:unnamed protein product, partial [Symbiodinium sp. CCMP2456]